MGKKAKNIGRNLDSLGANPPPSTTDIEPVAPPTIVNATGLAEEVPAASPEGESGENSETESKSSWKKDDVRESIYEKRNKQIAENLGIEEEKPQDTETTPPSKETTEEAAEGEAVDVAPSGVTAEVQAPASAPEVPGITTADATSAASPPQKYPVIVNGQRIEYTLEELQQQAQLGVAARQKFEEAAELRRQAEQIAASRQNSQPQQAVDNNTTQQLPDISPEELRDIAKRMNYGSEEEQVAALREAIAIGMRQGRQGPTPDQLVNVATQNALAVLTAQQEQDILKKEYPDIASDAPIAYATDLIATQLAHKYAALGQPKTRLDLLREAGNMAREKYLKTATSTPQIQTTPAVPPTTVAVNSNKIERKRTAPQTPTGTSRVANSSANGNANASPEAIAQEMRRNAFAQISAARGRPVI